MWALTLLAVLHDAQGARRAPGFVRRRDGREKYRASRRQTNVDRGVEITSECEDHAVRPRRLIDFDIATLFGFPRTRELIDRRELPGLKSYRDLLTELHGEVCTANTGAAARAAAARARWNRPVT